MTYNTIVIEKMRLIKKIIALIVLYSPPLFLDGVAALKRFFVISSKPLLLDYLELFLLHHYPTRNFNPFQFKENVKILWRRSDNDWLRADRSGELSIVRTFWGKALLFFQNLLSLGAFHKRLERSIYFTFLSMEIEFLNPYDENLFKVFLERKEAYLWRLLKTVRRINCKYHDIRPIQASIRLYKIGSLDQARIIQEMREACERQGVPEIVKRAEEGLESGLFPVLIARGRSGAYWMRSKEKEVLGIFKPFDEEPFAFNNPTRTGEHVALGERRIRLGVRVGEAAHNEVAAYQLDAFFGFGIVPRTYYACFTHQAFYLLRENPFYDIGKRKKKYGSFQEFIEGFVPIPELPLEYIEKIPIDDYQTVLLFDLLTGNSDRHMNNLLVGEDKLAAIDHGLCFTDMAPKMALMIWGSFPQSSQPFHPEVKKLVNEFPFERLSWKLRKNCFRSLESMERMRERVMLFRAAVNRGLVPKEMVCLLTRENFERLMDQKSGKEALAQEIVDTYVPITKPPLLERWLGNP